MPAKFSKDYTAKIKREVRRYQKERSKLIRKGIYENVPRAYSYKDLVNKYYSKREMNKVLKEMSLFTAARATKATKVRGKVYTQYEVAKFRLMLNRERKALSRELDLMQGFDAESPLAHNRYIKNLEARLREVSKNWRDIIGTRAGNQVLLKAEKAETFYTNWINAFFQDAEKLGFSSEKMDEIIKKLNKLTPQQFERLYNEDPSINYIMSYYVTEVKGAGELGVDDDEILQAFNDFYDRLDLIIDRYTKLK